MSTDAELERMTADAVAAVLAALPKVVQHRLSEASDVRLSHADIRRLHDEAMAAHHRLAEAE